MRVYSSMVRMAFNRFQDGMCKNDVRKHLRKFFDVNCWPAMSATVEAQALFNRLGQKRAVFGGKYNLIQYLRKRISKEQFRENRLRAINSCGEANYKGNRLVDFDLSNNCLFYKPKKGVRIEVDFCKVRKKLAKELEALQELAEQRKIPVTVALSNEEIRLSYDETLIHQEAYKGLKPNRILGIDMNPNYIGVSVIEFDGRDEFKALHKEVLDLSQLTKKSGEASNSKKSKYLTNKLRRETIDIAHRISKLMDCWKCSKLAIEDLSFGSKLPSKELNRLCYNKWQRTLFTAKLKMLAGIHKFELVEINPAHSSITGNLAYGNESTPDMVAASIEIARRAYKKFEKGWFYPKFNVEAPNEQWKQTLAGVKTWKGLFLKIKESKLKYRFQLLDCIQNAVFSKNYIQRHYSVYAFA